MEALAQITEKTVEVDGEIPTGFLFASVKNIGDQEVMVNGVPLAPKEAKTYPFVGKGQRAIPFQVNGSKLLVMYHL